VPRVLLVCLLVSGAAACSHTPAAPASPDSVSGLTGRTVDAITGSASTRLDVVVGSYRAVRTDDEGRFAIEGVRPGDYAATVRGSGVVERQTTISASGASATISMIPSGFDLVAFDEMFRAENARLQRWTTPPALVVLATTMIFTSTGQTEFVASAEQMTDDEVAQMVAHLTDGLALLTGSTFTGFASVTVERPGEGDRVRPLRGGSVVVGRYTGIRTLANTIGYGRWAASPGGSITGGAMFLDRDFDRGDARRRLLRVHELGHALGYQHVESRTSIMNPAIGPEPTEFDRAGAVIAFQRPVGNRSPDVDPAGTPRLSSLSAGGAAWSPPLVCR
jgi:hypothetical protein